MFHGLCFKILLKGVKIHERKKKEKIHYEVLDEGYNVVRAEINRHTIILTSMVKCNFKTRNGSHSYIFWNNIQKK